MQHTCIVSLLKKRWCVMTRYVLQHAATRCNTLQHAASGVRDFAEEKVMHDGKVRTATHCNTLQHTAAHCTTLHHSAPHCNTL